MGKKLFMLLCALCLAACLPVSALAANTEYRYTVRVFAGSQGTIGGQEAIIEREIPYGVRFTFDPKSVTVNDAEKYYVKGIRESGSDNSDATEQLSFEVTEDRDYVVAYGIWGNRIAYTVNYQDEDGNTLLPSETFYGNVGDRPVVAFQYVEGYQPQAYNLTGTLSENAAENVFTFTYSRLTAAETSPAPTNQQGGTAAGDDGENPADAEDAEDVDNPEANPGENAENANDPENAVTLITPNPVPAAEGTEDLQNIDDGQVPLAGSVQKYALEFAKRLNDMPPAGKAGIVSCTALVLGGIWWLMFHRKKKREVYE